MSVTRREASIERGFVAQLAKLHPEALCLKFNAPGARGVPDRLVLLPGGIALFIEFKAPGKAPSRLQAHQHARLRRKGFDVLVTDDIDVALWWVDERVAFYKEVSK